MIDWSTAPGVRESVLARLQRYNRRATTIVAVYLASPEMKVIAEDSNGNEFTAYLPYSDFDDEPPSAEASSTSVTVNTCSDAPGGPSKRMLLMLALFVAPAIRDAVIGDAEERYRRDVEQFGMRQAAWLLRWDVLRTAVLWSWRIVEAPALRLLGALRGAVRGR